MTDNYYYSIDRLIEFGMSMAIAQQMVQTMNNTMQAMHIPGSMNPMQTAPQLFYAMIEEKQAGPFSEKELLQLISDKTICKETFVWKAGMSNWKTIENIPEVLKLIALSPPPFNHQN